MSASMRARNSAGVVGIASMIWAASFSRIAGALSAWTTARRTEAMTASGVPAGAIRPFQASASTSTPASRSVAMPGRSAERSLVVIARIFTCPEARCGVTEIAARARVVLDHEALPEVVLQVIGDQPHDDVGCRARPEGHDQLHLAGRPFLRGSGMRQGPQGEQRKRETSCHSNDLRLRHGRNKSGHDGYSMSRPR